MRSGSVGNLRHPVVVLRVHVLHVAQPVVGEAHALVLERRRDAAAAVVAAHDDVLDLEHVDRELHRPTGS